MELKDRIAGIRKYKGLTQAELAQKIGMTTRAIQNYESGNRIPKSAVLEKIAEGLGVTIDDLASEDDKFVIQATEQYGSRGKVDAQQLIENANALFAGGDITEEDKTYVMEALQEAYWRAKIKNKRHIPKKYRKDNSDNTEKNSEN
jgi:transcriptional regulator with XRE-family HTH domain